MHCSESFKHTNCGLTKGKARCQGLAGLAFGYEFVGGSRWIYCENGFSKKEFDQLPPGKTPLKKLRYLLPTSPWNDDWEGVFPTPDSLPEGGSIDTVLDAIRVGWPIMV
jgi:hypothetical protein